MGVPSPTSLGAWWNTPDGLNVCRQARGREGVGGVGVGTGDASQARMEGLLTYSRPLKTTPEW